MHRRFPRCAPADALTFSTRMVYYTNSIREDDIDVTDHSDVPSSDCLQRAAASIAAGTCGRAVSELEEALCIEIESRVIMTALKHVSFWHDREQCFDRIDDPYERGEYLLAQWEVFQAFSSSDELVVTPIRNALRSYVFHAALIAYREVYAERENREPRLLVRIARCYKALGSYEEALRFARAAAGIRSDDALVLAELADVLALVNRVAEAKAFFREAFFVDPQAVPLRSLESQVIVRLYRRVSELGFKPELAREWLPVYGVLYGVFSVPRELRPIEFGRLKQSIYELERELRERTGDTEVIKPRLLNRYFWLLDHYTITGESQRQIEEVKLKVRSVDQDVYHHYNA